MVKENKFGQTALVMKANERIIRLMEKESFFILMVISMMVSFIY